MTSRYDEELDEQMADALRDQQYDQEYFDSPPRGHFPNEPVNYAPSDPLFESLAHRHQSVTNLTKYYYRGDLVPPSTKSQILRAQKFSVMYYYAMNAIFFLYAFFIPATLPGPWYGGLNIQDFYASPPHLLMMGIVFALLLTRLLVMSWQAEFYQFILVLAGLEAAAITFTAIFWSHGLPVLLILFLSNLMNLAVTQFYWKWRFVRYVQALPKLVPPAAPHVQDTTVLSLFDLRTFFVDFVKLWGFVRDHETEAELYDERCGVFGTKDTMSHVKAMQSAYMQAVDPYGLHVPWRHSSPDLWGLSFFGLFDGLLNTFITNAAVCFSGLWLGAVAFENFFHAGYAVMCALLLVSLYFASVSRTVGWLEDALGVAVAEKEWLAHDVIHHHGQREEIVFDVLDVTGTAGNLVSPDFMNKNTGRLNIVFMWLCVASIADFIGESYLAKMYWNIALETRYMMEALTPYDFKLFPHAKWEVTFKGVLIKSLQTLVVSFIACLYFGTYFEFEPLPVPLMAVLGAACFIQSVMKLLEAVHFAFSILGAGHHVTNRHKYVSEWVVGVALIFVLINILLWLYLLPMMKGWDLPVGKCHLDFNKALFPGACAGRG